MTIAAATKLSSGPRIILRRGGGSGPDPVNSLPPFVHVQARPDLLRDRYDIERNVQGSDVNACLAGRMDRPDSSTVIA